MSTSGRFGSCFIAAAVVFLGGTADAVDIPLPATATYLHVCRFDPAANAAGIDLAALGISPGDAIGLQVIGDWDATFYPVEDPGDVQTGTWAVFSTSNVLLDGGHAHRVPGAIAAGSPNTTPPTFNCNQEPTDIPEDFSVPADTPRVLVVPAGATHLFTSPADWNFFDNTDPDGDYALRITTMAISVDGSSWGRVKGQFRANAAP